MMNFKKYDWDKFLFVEEEFVQAMRYVDFVVENMNATSVFFSNKIVFLGSEIEKDCKYLLKLVDSSLPRGNMKNFKEGILNFYPKIVDFRTYIKGSDLTFQPFQSWNEKNGRLPWWDAYNNEKHGLKTATLRDSLELLAALEILLYIIHSEETLKREGMTDGCYTRYTLLELPNLMETKFLRRVEMSDGFFVSFLADQFKGRNIETLCDKYENHCI